MRVDLYGVVHKGLRTVLFDTSVELARTDFASAAERRIATNAYRRSAGFLREHHEHEEAFCEPLIATRAPEVVAMNRSQHERIDAALSQLDADFAALESADDIVTMLSIGRGIVSHYDEFLAVYLAHMRHEETAMTSAFWAHCTDDELASARARLHASMPPERFGEWLGIMLPAMNVDERAGMFVAMKAGAPPPALRFASEIGMRVLGQSAWSALSARAELG